jgi:hypothetical protein
LETAAKLLKSPERVLAVFSKCALKLWDNQADFDSAILGTRQTASRVRRFEIVRTRS